MAYVPMIKKDRSDPKKPESFIVDITVRYREGGGTGEQVVINSINDMAALTAALKRFMNEPAIEYVSLDKTEITF